MYEKELDTWSRNFEAKLRAELRREATEYAAEVTAGRLSETDALKKLEVHARCIGDHWLPEARAIVEEAGLRRAERRAHKANGYDTDADNVFQFRGRANSGEPKQSPSGESHKDPGLGEWDAGDDAKVPDPRGWLLGNAFCRGFMSSLLADGGVGKTAVRYVQLLSLATGRPLTGEHVFQRCRVLIVSLEDDAKELQRRILAARLHHHVELSELKGWLFLAAPGAAGGKLMVPDKANGLVRGQLANRLEHVIQTRKIDLVYLDPFIKSHAVEENSNTAIDEVAQLLTDMAAKFNVAVDTPHHTSKGTAEPRNANRGRGASAHKDAARLIYTASPMTTEEAAALGISEDARKLLLRIDSGKVNIAPPMTKAKWFRLVSVPLGNATETYPSGDMVQTVEPWTPPDTWGDLPIDLLNRILTVIDGGLPDGNRYSDQKNVAEGRAAWKVVIDQAPQKTQAQAREIISTWVKNGVLYRQNYKNADSKTVSGLYLEPSKRPG